MLLTVVCLFFGGVSCPAVAQVRHGSVGVVYFAKDAISIAADSRESFVNPTIPPEDTGCKVAAFRDQVVFVSSACNQLFRLCSRASMEQYSRSPSCA
jgi:hypothetical protein